MQNDHEKKPRGATQSSHPYGAKEICHTVGISHRQLDYWVLIGVVTPHLERHGAKLFRRFSQHDVAVLVRIKQLIDEGVVVSRAAERVRREMGHEITEPSNGGRPAATATPLNEQEPETDAA
jgi:DNA-binding transcriptional MerR regulator